MKIASFSPSFSPLALKQALPTPAPLTDKKAELKADAFEKSTPSAAHASTPKTRDGVEIKIPLEALKSFNFEKLVPEAEGTVADYKRSGLPLLRLLTDYINSTLEASLPERTKQNLVESGEKFKLIRFKRVGQENQVQGINYNYVSAVATDGNSQTLPEEAKIVARGKLTRADKVLARHLTKIFAEVGLEATVTANDYKTTEGLQRYRSQVYQIVK